MSIFFLCFFYVFSSYLISIVSPTTELHIAMLIIKREPRDVYLACAFKDARGHVQTTAVMFDHDIGLIRPIESLIRTIIQICQIFVSIYDNQWITIIYIFLFVILAKYFMNKSTRIYLYIFLYRSTRYYSRLCMCYIEILIC